MLMKGRKKNIAKQNVDDDIKCTGLDNSREVFQDYCKESPEKVSKNLYGEILFDFLIAHYEGIIY